MKPAVAGAKAIAAARLLDGLDQAKAKKSCARRCRYFLAACAPDLQSLNELGKLDTVLLVCYGIFMMQIEQPIQ